MADDLGDSHFFSLGQGGKLPLNSVSHRYVGKIHSDTGLITLNLYPTDTLQPTTLIITDDLGLGLDSIEGSGILTLSYNCTYPGDYKIKVRNAVDTINGQVVRVKANYLAPAEPHGSFPVTTNQVDKPSISIYPNPSKGLINISIPYLDKAAEMGIYNDLGQKVYHTVFRKSKVSVDLNQLKRGSYYLNIFNQNFLVQEKIILLKD
jgi:hypothetical protein